MLSAPLGLSTMMPRSTHHKSSCPTYFTPRSQVLVISVYPTAISLHFINLYLSPVYTKTALCAAYGNLYLPLAISSYPLTNHKSYLTWLVSGCGHPFKTSFLIHYFARWNKSLFFRLLPPSATYPRQESLIPLYILPLNSHKITTLILLRLPFWYGRAA